MFKLGVIMLFISLTLITTGLYITYLTSPKRVISKFVENLTSSIYYSSNKNTLLSKQIINDKNSNMTINSNFKMSINSPYFTQNSSIDETSLKYSNLFKNLSNITGTVTFIQDNFNEKFLFLFNSSLYNQPYYASKYLIQDFTEYQYLNDLNNNYINNGNNNYFETAEKNPLQNINKINSTILKNLTVQISNYLTISKEKLIINNKIHQYNKISLLINNENLPILLDTITSSIEEDSFLNNLPLKNSLISLIKNFKAFPENVKVIFNIYQTEITQKKLKYEFLIIDDKNNFTISYNLENNNGEVLKNNKKIYNLKINQNTNKTYIDIFDTNNQKIGHLLLYNDDHIKEIEFNFDNGNINWISNYQNIITKTKQDYSYNIVQRLNLKVTNKSIEVINLNFNLNSDIEENAIIEEDVSTSVFKSSITDLEKEQYKLKIAEKLNKLYE